MLSSLDRQLKYLQSPYRIAKDREFQKCRDVLEGKARALRQQGYGKRPNASKPLNAEDEEQLWSSGVMGSHSPNALISTLWFILSLHFGLRGCQEHHSMFVEDFTIDKDDNGNEYLTNEENPTKTRQGGLRIKRRAVKPKMFPTGGARCPVRLFRSFLIHRPEGMQNSGPFYLGVLDQPKSVTWYKRQRMGINTINSFMKTMCQDAGVNTEERKLTNHTVRKTLVKKLKASNQPRSAIIGVTGHTNERSLIDYEEGDEIEQRHISNILSAPMGQQMRQPLSTVFPASCDNPVTPSVAYFNNFHGCQVTINYGTDASVSQQQVNMKTTD
ncbi:hypothetical protein QZH41_000672 [Actinostola sp. cb2023]|nr:hypothetical protein QZH41_000672 [Actinostola sp. cb2023]